MTTNQAADSTVSEASSPVKVTKTEAPPPPQRSAVGTTFQLRSEIPAIPNTAIAAFEASQATDKSAGNFEYSTELLDKGFVGYWRKRAHTCHEATPIYISPVSLYNAMATTLVGTLTRLFQLKTQLPGATLQNRVTEHAAILASGCCITAFLKVRNLITSELPGLHVASNLRRPRAKDSFAIPSGFAFAIQQLGIVNVADSPTERIYVPCFPTTGHTNGVPNIANAWNPNAYAQAVEYARSLGLQFSMVDLKKKDGSAWWLLRQTYEDDIFELQCTIPEVNFTKAMVLTLAMFLNGDEQNPTRPIFDLTPLGAANHGIMMRNPHIGINISSYEAVSQEAPEVVANV